MQFNKKTGFTIVELLIVVVVIAILAAITVVAYNGIQNRAKQSAVQSALSQATKKIMLYAVVNGDAYPIQLSEAGVQSDPKTTYQYSSDNSTSNRTFNLSVTTSDGLSYNTSNTQTSPAAGLYLGHSFAVWNKFDPSTSPLPAATLDALVFRNAAPSLRIAPSNPGVGVRGSPFAVTTGEVFEVSFWMQTDANWNGLMNNSKIRFGDPSVALKSCSYNGVKATWTYFSCSYTVPTGVSSLVVTVGNDGTVGNIWLDDFVITRR